MRSHRSVLTLLAISCLAAAAGPGPTAADEAPSVVEQLLYGAPIEFTTAVPHADTVLGKSIEYDANYAVAQVGESATVEAPALPGVGWRSSMLHSTPIESKDANDLADPKNRGTRLALELIRGRPASGHAFGRSSPASLIKPAPTPART